MLVYRGVGCLLVSRVSVVESTTLLFGTSDTRSVKISSSFLVLKYLNWYLYFQILRNYFFEQILMALLWIGDYNLRNILISFKRAKIPLLSFNYNLFYRAGMVLLISLISE